MQIQGIAFATEGGTVQVHIPPVQAPKYKNLLFELSKITEVWC